MRNYRMTVAYDGTAYAGWQSQAAGNAIQDVIERILRMITGERVALHCSGRTDAGVHALGQVATFRTHSNLAPAVWLRALHGHLPPDISVLEIAEAPYDFHPRTAAKLKRYRYLDLGQSRARAARPQCVVVDASRVGRRTHA
ncbi:MAG: tRNA pseudouridine synthase A [Pirellulales bacterium]